VARITFQKRQKEMKRQEKQRMKAEKRAQRKIEKTDEPSGNGEVIFSPEDREPQITESEIQAALDGLGLAERDGR
jgi:hypothetical protein